MAAHENIGFWAPEMVIFKKLVARSFIARSLDFHNIIGHNTNAMIDILTRIVLVSHIISLHVENE